MAEGLSFEDTTEFETSEEAWAYADKIEAHVVDTVADMEKIFAQREVNILNYGAISSEQSKNQNNGMGHKTDEDAQAERELAINNTKAIYAAIKEVSEAGRWYSIGAQHGW